MDNPKIKLLASTLKNDYYSFFCFFWPLISDEKLIRAKHIKYICDELTILGNSIINRLKPEFDWYIINIPPGTSKSSMVSILWPTWLLANDPSIFTINSSYSSDLSDGFVRKSKKVIDSQTFKLLFGEIAFTKETESFFETSKGGGRYATSTGGTIVGIHGNILISDDPLSVEQSYSKAARDRANRFLTSTLPERVRNKSITPIVLVMQRLHDDDPTGHILGKGANVKHICLPAELSEKATNKELYDNGLLDPIRINKEVISKKKIELGAFGYSGQYDQQPHPEGGGKIKKEWFNFIHEKELPGNLIWDLWVDGAYTKQTENDPTGLLLTANQENRLYIQRFHSAHLEMPELLKLIPNFVTSFTEKSKVFIEPKATGKTLRQLLTKDTRLNAVEIESHLVSEGKEARIQTAAPKVESGRVYLVKGQWNDEFIHQLEGFPTAKHDEAVDLLGYAVDYYFDKKRVTW